MASISQKGSSFLVRVYVKETGKTVGATFKPDPAKTQRQNRKDLELFAAEFERKVCNGLYLDGEKITFKEFAETWLKDYCEPDLEESTTEMYRQLLYRHIIPEIGGYTLSAVQPRTLNQLYRKLSKKKKADGSGTLSPTTVKRCKAIISSMYHTAMKWDVCDSDPTKRSDLPRSDKVDKVEYFTDEQAIRFLEALEKPQACIRKAHDRIDDTGKKYHVDSYIELQPVNPQYRLFFNMAIFCGCRRGELIALTWKDIDFTKKKIHIIKNTTIVGSKIVTTTPKTHSGIRTVSMPDVVSNMLMDWKTQEKEKMLALGTAWKGKRGKDFDENWVFIRDDGGQMYPSSPTGAFRKLIKRYNDNLPEGEEPLPYITLHGLRHTSATLSIAQGTDIRTVSARLGHAQTSTTLNIYSHAIESKDAEAAKMLENLLIRRKG